MMKNTLYLLKNATHTQMQSLIAADESGKLIVIDGGNTGDAMHLLEKLKEISGSEVPSYAYAPTAPILISRASPAARIKA